MRKSVVDQAKGNESYIYIYIYIYIYLYMLGVVYINIYIYIGVWRLSETNTNKFQETRLSKSKPRSKFVWIHKTRI